VSTLEKPETGEQKRPLKKRMAVIKVLLILTVVIGEIINIKWFWDNPNTLLDTLLNVLVAGYLFILVMEQFKYHKGRSYAFAIIAGMLLLTNILIIFFG
jgi:uncharacterized membrane protein